MEAIVLRRDLQEVLERDAELQSKTLSDLVNEAVAHYLRDREREKIARETEAYERMHPQLVPDLLGQWVAVHEGEIVDRDSEVSQLLARVRARFGRLPILIRQVSERPVDDIHRRTPSTGRIAG